MTAQILGRGVHDDIGTVGERILQVRRGERVVDDNARSVRVGNFGHGSDVEAGEHRVGRGLEPYDRRLRRELGGEAIRVGEVEGPPWMARWLEDLVDQPKRPAVGVVPEHHPVAGTEHRAQEYVLGGKTAGEGEPVFSALEGGQTGLDRGPHRVARPGVFIGPGPEAANAVLGEGRRQADRRHHGARARISLLTRVDGPGLKSPAELFFDLAHAQQSRPPTGSRRPLSGPTHCSRTPPGDTGRCLAPIDRGNLSPIPAARALRAAQHRTRGGATSLLASKG